MAITFSENTTKNILTIIFIIILAVSIRASYAYWKMYTENILLKVDVAGLEKALEIKEENIFRLTGKNTTISYELQTEKANNEYFQGQIQTISNTVGVLEKLSKTDSQLLEKYSKVFFLNENYVPQKLSVIDPKYYNVKDKTLEIHTDVLSFMQRMLNDALTNDKITIQVLSAYRSFGTQAVLKSSYKFTYGSGTANSFSAEQGYSEHQLGTTLDFTTQTVGPGLSGFDKTTAYTWLLNNAYKYGFILSYPKNNAYYVYEPWHWRFVGIQLATKLHNENKYFYDLDQREISQFLISIFD